MTSKHQVGYDFENKIVTIRGLVDDVPFGVEVDAQKHTARILNNTTLIVPKGNSVPDKKQGDCPGCKDVIGKLVRGGIGWAKELFHLDTIPPHVAQARKAMCETCPSDCYDFGVCRDDWPDRPPEEQGCGCILSLKILQGSEECPHAHWTSYASL